MKRVLLAVVAALAIGLAMIPASASAAPEDQRGYYGHHGYHGGGYRGNTTVIVEQFPVSYPAYYAPTYAPYAPTYATYAPTYAVVYCPAFGYYTYAAYCP